MKKLIEMVNPFILLLIPVMAAVILGMNYQFKQTDDLTALNTAARQPVPLFYQGVHLIKALCSINEKSVW